jgi:hypothetical protein
MIIVEELFKQDKDNIIEDIAERIMSDLNYKVKSFLLLNENTEERKLCSISPDEIRYIGRGEYIISYPKYIEDKDSEEINIIFPDAYEEFDDLYEELRKIEKAFPDKKIWIDYSAPYTEALENVIDNQTKEAIIYAYKNKSKIQDLVKSYDIYEDLFVKFPHINESIESRTVFKGLVGIIKNYYPDSTIESNMIDAYIEINMEHGYFPKFKEFEIGFVSYYNRINRDE